MNQEEIEFILTLEALEFLNTEIKHVSSGFYHASQKHPDATFIVGDFDDEPSGQLYACGGCEKVETWGPDWSWVGSWRDIDDGNPVLTVCSVPCWESARRKELANVESRTHSLGKRGKQRGGYRARTY